MHRFIDSAGKFVNITNYGESKLENIRLVGIVSFGNNSVCTQSDNGKGTSPGVYTKVSSYISWIEKITQISYTEFAVEKTTQIITNPAKKTGRMIKRTDSITSTSNLSTSNRSTITSSDSSTTDDSSTASSQETSSITTPNNSPNDISIDEFFNEMVKLVNSYRVIIKDTIERLSIAFK